MNDRAEHEGTAAALQRLTSGFLVSAALWLLLTEGRWDSWTVGLPTVVAAAYLAWRLRPPRAWQWSLGGWLRFLPLFVRNVLLGAMDVAWRSLHPRLPISPQMIPYQLRLPAGTARVFFMNVVNLLPGTLSADHYGETLTVHVFDTSHPVESQLRELEEAVARMFRVSVTGVPEELGR